MRSNMQISFVCTMVVGIAALQMTPLPDKGKTQSRSMSISSSGSFIQRDVLTTKVLAQIELKYRGLLVKDKHEGDVSPEELARLEEKYGGYVANVTRRVHSQGGGGDHYVIHQGGDRFIPGHNHKNQHNYGKTYTEYLNKLFHSQTPIQQVAEVGILKGSGVAMWLELFPDSEVYAFDIDPSNFEANRGNLKKLGMNDANLKVVTMDQTLDNSRMLQDQVGGQFTFIVDDGCHTRQCARLTIKSFLPRMTDTFLYIIEDSAGKHLVDEIKGMAHGVNAEQRGPLTMVSRGL